MSTLKNRVLKRVVSITYPDLETSQAKLWAGVVQSWEQPADKDVIRPCSHSQRFVLEVGRNVLSQKCLSRGLETD